MSGNQIQRNYQCVRMVPIINYPDWQTHTNETRINRTDPSRKHICQHTQDDIFRKYFETSFSWNISIYTNFSNVSLRYRYVDWNLKSILRVNANRDKSYVKRLTTFYIQWNNNEIKMIIKNHVDYWIPIRVHKSAVYQFYYWELNRNTREVWNVKVEVSSSEYVSPANWISNMYLAVHGIQRSIFSFQTHVIVVYIDVGKHSRHFLLSRFIVCLLTKTYVWNYISTRYNDYRSINWKDHI